MTCVPGVETEAASLFLPFVYMLTVCIFKIVLMSTSCNKQNNKTRTQKSETFVCFMIKLLFVSKTTTSSALFRCQKSSFIRSRRVRTPISQTSLYMQNRPINVALIFFSLPISVYCKYLVDIQSEKYMNCHRPKATCYS